MGTFWCLCIVLLCIALVMYEDRRRRIKLTEQTLNAAIKKQEECQLELSELELAIEEDVLIRRQEKVDFANTLGIKIALLDQIVDKNKKLVEQDVVIQKLKSRAGFATLQLVKLQTKLTAANELNTVLKQRVSNINDEMNGMASRMPTTTKEQLDILTQE